MDLETVSGEEFGRSLTGIGLNLLTRDVRGLAGRSLSSAAASQQR